MVSSVYSCVSLLFMSRRPTAQKNTWPRPDLQFQIRPNPAPALYEKIISGATLVSAYIYNSWYCCCAFWHSGCDLPHGRTAPVKHRLISGVRS